MTKKQEALKNAKESWKKIVKWWKDIIRWTAKVLLWTGKSLYYLIDAWDKAIWEKIEKKQLKKWKNATWKFKQKVRDNLIKTLIAVWAVWYWGYQWWKFFLENEDKKWIEVIDNNVKWNSSETLLIPMAWFDILKWKKITTNAPLTRRYLWWDLENSWDLVIWDTLVLNSSKSLHNLWTKKIGKYWQYTTDISKLDSIDVSGWTPEKIENFRIKYPIDATYLFVVKPYVDWKEDKWKMSLKQFIAQSNKIVETLKVDTKDYDWWFEWSKKDLFNAIRDDITWECVVAYAMTELCENKENWEFNKQLFDLLLRNSGVNYLSNVPAIYDEKTSYWLYQFTEYALFDTPKDVRWASVVNKKMPKDKKLPWSVMDLKTWKDQTKAAYMFALYNMKLAISKLSDNQAKALITYQKSHKEKFRDNMTQLIAMCHHMPAACSALKKWQEEWYKKDIYNYGGTHTQPYWKASKNNYEALKK